MSSSQDMVASQLFFYIKRNVGESAYAFITPEGLTGPIFSSPELAQNFLQRSGLRNYGVGLISPVHLINFSDTCKKSGAKFLQLDPKIEALKKSRAINIAL